MNERAAQTTFDDLGTVRDVTASGVRLRVVERGSGPKLLMLPTHAGHSGHAGDEEFRGGPDITFDGLMPRPGRYRAFTQFRWRDELHTFSFAFDVIDAAAVEPVAP